MADFYQSEVSRLVLSFLVEENLVNSANTFQAESIHLSEVGIVSIPYYKLINFKEIRVHAYYGFSILELLNI